MLGLGEMAMQRLLVETEIPGVLVMLAFTFATIRTGFAPRHVADPDPNRLLLALAAILLAPFAALRIGPTTSDSPAAPFAWGSTASGAYWSDQKPTGRLAVLPARTRNTLALV